VKKEASHDYEGGGGGLVLHKGKTDGRNGVNGEREGPYSKLGARRRVVEIHEARERRDPAGARQTHPLISTPFQMSLSIPTTDLIGTTPSSILN
jgi:hypothetical protein